jgi:5-bromo-4-chloroindolyl phosphate hydrolysis protein
MEVFIELLLTAAIGLVVLVYFSILFLMLLVNLIMCVKILYLGEKYED